jgi:hypothetical protein
LTEWELGSRDINLCQPEPSGSIDTAIVEPALITLGCRNDLAHDLEFASCFV